MSIPVPGDTLAERIAHLVADHPDWSSEVIAEVLDSTPESVRSTASRHKIRLGRSSFVPGRPAKAAFRRHKYAGYDPHSRW